MLRIGIVEDECIIAESIDSALKQLGYEVSGPAADFESALAMIEADRPDFLILDIKIHGTHDGIELANYINENFQIPFIFLTANSETVSVERAKQTNPVGYLVKPFTKEDLYTTIEISFSNYLKLRSNNTATAISRRMEIIWWTIAYLLKKAIHFTRFPSRIFYISRVITSM